MYIRSVICKAANNLRKKGYTLSAAFRAAWRLAKSKAAVKVAGVSKYNRQTALDHLRRRAAAANIASDFYRARYFFAAPPKISLLKFLRVEPSLPILCSEDNKESF